MNKRILWVDVAKAIGIYFIVLVILVNLIEQ